MVLLWISSTGFHPVFVGHSQNGLRHFVRFTLEDVVSGAHMELRLQAFPAQNLPYAV